MDCPTANRPLVLGRIIGFDFTTVSYRFTMREGANEFRCAIKAKAMDLLERHVWPHERSDQFKRLWPAIERVVTSKFDEGKLSFGDEMVILGTDFHMAAAA